MRRSSRDTVRVRYNLRCGYCRVSETHIGAKMTVDHFLPRIHGGDDSLDNLVYCCHACNEFKGDYWQTDPDLRLLHPLLDDTAKHFQEQDDNTLQALTERGVNHIKILQLNREELIAHRREQHDIAAVRARCKMLEEYIAGLEQTEEANDAMIGQLFGDASA
jgi:hypothetical protein